MAEVRPSGGILFKLTVNHTLHGQMCQNGFYFTNRPSQNDDVGLIKTWPAALISSFNIRLMTDITAFWNNQVALVSLIATCIVPSGGPTAETIYTTTTGFQPNEALPGYCAAILSLRTGFGGKSNRGRLYFTGVSEDDSHTGRLGVDSHLALVEIGNKLIANYGATGSDPLFRYVIFSRHLGTGRDEAGVIDGVRFVSQCIARHTLGTQRHRMIGVGN